MRPNWTVAGASWMWLALAGCGSEQDAPTSVNPFGAAGSGSGGASGSAAVTPTPPAGTGGSVSETPVTPILQPTPPVVPPVVVPPVAGDCTVPPPPSELIGWASEGTGTTGGGNATPVVVTTADDLIDNAGGTEPRVIHVRGTLNVNFNIGSNKTVIGTCGAELRGHIGFNDASNTILRNLRVVGFNCTDNPADCSGGDDAITIGGGSDHIWVDHLDVSDGSDGNLDVTQGSDFVTVSYTKFSYSTRRTDPLAGDSGHRFSNLIGSSDTDARDPGRLNVTYHHNWWADNVDQRMPRTRRGQIHVFNNLYTAAGNSYCTNAGFEARLLVQNNVYVGVNRPIDVSTGGDLLSEGNLFQGTTGNQDADGVGFVPPYDFQLDATQGLEAALRAEVGPQ